MKKLFSILFFAGFTFLSGERQLYAEEFLHSSIFDGRTPYKIIRNTSDLEINSQPSRDGVYFGNETGSWELAIQGQLLAGQTSQGILAQFELTKRSGRYESAAVKDGRLVFFDLMSRASDPSTWIQIGGEQGVSPRDLFSHADFDLDLIKSLSDVSVVPLELGVSGQAVLVSVKQKSPLGDGISFVLFLKDKSRNSDAKIELASGAVIIDYQFRTDAQLQNIIFGDRVVSELALRYHSRPRQNDPPDLHRWRENLSSVLYSVEQKNRLDNLTGPKSFLYFHPEKNSLFVEKLPSSSIPVAAGIQLQQVFDPISNRPELRWEGFSEALPPIASGQVLFDQEAYHFMAFNASAGGHHGGVVFVGSQMYFLFEPKGQSSGESSGNFHLRVASVSENAKYDDYTFLAFSRDLEEQGREIYLFSSSRIEDVTRVYVIREFEGTASFVRQFQVLDSYIDDFELQQRVQKGVYGQILFDNITPVEEGGADSYLKNYVDTRPLIDVGLSTERSFTQDYLNSLDQIELSERMQFLEYDSFGADRNISGVYITEDTDFEDVYYFPGRLLFDDDSDVGRESAKIVTELVFKKGRESFQDASLVVAAIDSQFGHGQNGFQLIAYLETEKPLSQNAVKVDIPVDYRLIENIQVIRGFNRHDREFYVLLQVRPDPQSGGTKKPSGGVVFAKYQIEEKKEDGSVGYVLKPASIIKLLNGEVSAAEIERRLAVDKSGSIYWALNGDMDRRSSKFSLFNLTDNKKIFPNSREERGSKILYDAQAREAGLGTTQRDSTLKTDNPWIISTARQLKRVADFDEKEDESRIKDELKLYEGLIRHFEDLANPERTPKHEILVVTPDQKRMMQKIIRYSLSNYSSDGSIWSLYSSHLNFAAFSLQDSFQIDIIQNLLDLRQTKPDRRSVFYSTMEDLLTVGRPTESGEGDELLYAAPSDSVRGDNDLPHILDLISREGDVQESSDFETPPKVSQRLLSSLILATPEDLELVDEQEPELLQRFDLNIDYLHATWRLWPPRTKRTTQEIIQLAQMQGSDLEQEIFSDLMAHLQALSDPSQPAKHKVFIVPEELKPILQRTVLKAWALNGDSGSGDEIWSARNPRLRLFKLDPNDTTQATVLENYRAMRGTENARSLLWADVDQISRINRPSVKNQKKPFLLKDPAVGGVDSQEDSSKPSAGTIPPHLLWLIATDGRRVSPEEFSAGMPSLVSTCLFATEKEWLEAQKSIDFESRFGLDKHFDVYQLVAPSIQRMRRILKKVLEKPEIAALQYKFETAKTEKSIQSAQDDLLAYLVNKTTTLANQFGTEKTTAFIRVLHEFGKLLVEDSDLRKSKLVDQAFVDRLLTRVFNIPLNLATLSPDDPDVRLSNVKQMAWDLQNAGYLGPLELKYLVIETLLAHFRGRTAGLNVPSSVILIGETSTGKTFLFRKLMEVLGLQLYDYANPSNPDANAFIVNVGEISTKEDSPMHIDRVLEHLQNFIALPLGYRGFILFDDAHKAANDEILGKLISFQQSLFEAPEGIARVKTFGDETLREVPVRNLRLLMTLNPTLDARMKERFATSGSDVDMVVASLSGNKPIERSFVQRWGALINLTEFPVEAKGPALAQHLSGQVQSDFNLRGIFTLVDPSAVFEVSSHFPQANAREFLNSAGHRLLQVPEKEMADAEIRIVIPVDRQSQRKIEGEGAGDSSFAKPAWQGTGRKENEIASFIEETMTSFRINREESEGRLLLMSMMADGMRTQMMQSLASALTESPQFVDDQTMRRNALAPMLHALTAHLRFHAAVPLSMLNIDPHEFGVSGVSAREEFAKTLIDLDEVASTTEILPIGRVGDANSQALYNRLTTSSGGLDKQRTRADVLLETVVEVKEIQSRILALILRVPSLTQLPSAEDWLNSIEEQDPNLEMRQFGDELLSVYRRFSQRLFESRLLEMTETENYQNPTVYDSFRLFLQVMDKALTQLPWVKSQKFILDGMLRATGDLNFGQLPGVQHYFFKSRISATRPAPKNFTFQVAQSSADYKEWDAHYVSKRERSYLSGCPKFIRQLGTSRGDQ